MRTPRHLPTTIAAVVSALCLSSSASPAALAAPASAVPNQITVSLASQSAGQYVALGDSFSSGLGAGSTYDSCLRTKQAYAYLVGEQWNSPVDLQACAGAVLKDVTANQVSALSATTSAVTLTIGGNDLGFSRAMGACAMPAWLSDCAGALRAADRGLDTTFDGQLAAVLRQVKTRAPHASLTLAGYPRLLHTRWCMGRGFISSAEEKEINRVADKLNAHLAGVARAQGFAFADVAPAFADHGVCAPAEWINGIRPAVNTSYHPNAAGHRAYAQVIAGSGTPAPEDVQDPNAHAFQNNPQLLPGFNSKDQLAQAAQRGIDPAVLQQWSLDLTSKDTEVVFAAWRNLQDLETRFSNVGSPAAGS